MNIIGVGDNTLDCYIDKNTMYPGGNAVNVAVLSSRFGAIKAAYIGYIGSDKRGNTLYNALVSEGIDVSYSRVIDGKNSYEEIELIDGDRVFKYSYRGVSYDIKLTEDDFAHISNYDVLHTSVYSNIEKYLEDLSKLSVKLSFDFSDSFNDEYLNKYLKYVDFAFFSGSDLNDREINDLIEKSKEEGCELVLITRGGNGAILYYNDNIHEQSVLDTDVVDTLGAGDSFIATILVGLIDNKEVKQVLINAAKNAANTCTHYGAFGYGTNITEG